MNLFQINLRQSRQIPFVAMSLLMAKLAVSFMAMEMFTAMYVTQVGMMLTFLIALVLVIRDKTLHTFDILVFAYLLILEGISIISGTAWVSWLSTCLTISAFLFLFNFYRDKYHILMFGILFVLSFAIYCQLFQCILNPEKWVMEGDRELVGYVLGGNYNQIGIRIIMALTIAIWSAQYGKWFKVNLFFLIISSFAILFMVQSMTSLSCMILFLVFCLIKNQRLLSVGIGALFVGSFLFEVIVCFSGTSLQNNELASWFIKDVLGKDMTFTGRTYMWDTALQVISESPVWGYGFVDKEWYLSNMTSLAIGAHNFILNTLIYGGIIILVFYTAIIFKSIWHLIIFHDIGSKRLILSFAIINIMMLFEVYDPSLILLILTIMYYYPKSVPSPISPDIT